MALKDELKKLKAVKDEVESILDKLNELAKDDKNTTAALRKKIAALANKLSKVADAAAKERRKNQIKELDAVIVYYDNALLQISDPNLTMEISAARDVAKAKRGRLNSSLALDFAGLLSEGEVDELTALSLRVQKDVEQKKTAAAYIAGTIAIANLTMTIAGKLADVAV